VDDAERLVASGRDADVFAAGPGRVRRRSRGGRSQQGEAEVMQAVRAAGYPAPEVLAVSADGVDLVMPRLDGPTMLSDLGHRPWRLRGHAATLARLHRELGEVRAPGHLRSGPVPGDRVVHLDLHPGNVLLTPDGPVVIDWSNAAAGDPASDVALTWVLLACAESGATGAVAVIEHRLRSSFLTAFLRGVDRGGAAAVLGEVVAWKLADRNIRPAEAEAMRALARDVLGRR
jgi:aminoglycoside phosphotransferase (APT) family kinase protein